MVEHIQNLVLTSLQEATIKREFERFMVLLSLAIQQKMKKDANEDT